MARGLGRVSTESTPLVVRSYLGVMDRNPGDRGELAALWDRLLGMRGDVPGARAVAVEMEFATALASFHVRKLREGETYPTGAEMLATVEARLEAARDARKARATLPRRPDPYHPGAPTLPGNRSPSA